VVTLRIGGRPTFFPSFVNERFDPNNANGTGFWACTWSAFHVGIGVARWANIPATPRELQEMVKVSRDDNKRDGSRTEHMVAAAKARYGVNLRQENVSVAQIKKRLASGQTLIAGLWYGTGDGHVGLPAHFRRWSPGFIGGHRAALIGYDAARDRTMFIDPMANKGRSWTGEWIKWSEFEPAWWPDEQVWLAEGEGIMTTLSINARFPRPRNFSIRSRNSVAGFRLDRPGRRLRAKRFEPGMVVGKFDAVVSIQQAAGAALQPNGVFIRVTSGHFKGLYVRRTAVAANFATPPAPVDPGILANARLEGRREEFRRIHSAARIRFPDGGPGRRGTRTVESLQAEIARLKSDTRIDFPPDPDGVDDDEFVETPPPRRQPTRTTGVPETVSAGPDDPDPPDPADEPDVVPEDEVDVRGRAPSRARTRGR
jgi:hypothetical protein